MRSASARRRAPPARGRPTTGARLRRIDHLDELAVVRRRLHAQRLAAEPFARPEEVVGWLGAMQAQEYGEAKWSVGQRLRAGTDAAVEAALARGEILRTHVMRPTWHFVARRDVRWLLGLTAPRVQAGNRYWYGRFDLDADVLARGREVLEAALSDGEPRTRPELAAALARAGIAADGLRLGYVLMFAELEGVLCSGPRRGNQQTYALLAARAPVEDDLVPDDPLVELVIRFFRSHGPATVKDFAWWSGLTVTDARAGLERAGPALAREVAEDGTAWYAAPDEPAEHPPTGAVLAPMYDELVVAYKDLRVVLASPPQREGVLDRAIVLDGVTVGSWKRTVTARAAVIDATLFAPLEPAGLEALEAAVARFGAFMERPATLRATVATA